jgi:hypothetical protein
LEIELVREGRPQITSEKMQASAKTSEARQQSAPTTLTFKNSELSLENQVAQHQIEWLEQLLATKVNLMLDIKWIHTKETLDPKSQLSAAE